MNRPCTITPWSSMDGGLSRLLHDFVATGTPARTRYPGVFTANPASPSPAITAWETDTGYSFDFNVPGLGEGDVELEILDGVLTIRGSWPVVLPEDANVLRNERGSGEFTRTIQLPGEVDESGVQAEIQNGVLHLTLAKRPEAQPRRIEIASRSS